MTGELKKLEARVAELERLDREAATHVESLICMRTHFTGEYPYVGWRGLGLALKEHLDTQAAEIAALREAVAKKDAALQPFRETAESIIRLFGSRRAIFINVGNHNADENYPLCVGDLERIVAAAAYGRET